MLLAVDVGNTNIEIGCIEGEKILCTVRVATDHTKTVDEYAVLLEQLLRLRGMEKTKIGGAIIASVVPELRQVMSSAIRMLCGITPMIVGAGIKSGLDIRIDNPAQLGSDLVVGAVGAMDKYPKPLLVFDFGTATTLSVIDAKGTYRGGMIMPGLRLAVEALFSGTAQLPHISLEAPGKAIGTNTVDCMNAGVIYGNAAMVDGVIDRVEEELGEPVAAVVATGGLSSRIVPHCRHEVSVEKELMMWGLKIIYEKNKGR